MRAPVLLLIALAAAACTRAAPVREAPRKAPAWVEVHEEQDAGTAAPAPAPAPTPLPADGGEDSLAHSLELPPPPGDARMALFSKRLDFHNGEPLVPVRLMEGQTEVVFSARGRMRLKVPSAVEKLLEAPAGTVWRVRLTGGQPAQLDARVQLAELRFADKQGLSAAQQEWAARGVVTEVQTLGSVYGIAGKVVDNRSYLLLVQGAFTPKEAARRQAELLRAHGVRTQVIESLRAPPSGILEVLDETGTVVAVGQDRVDAHTLGGEAFDVRRVEYGVGYDFHNFEDRSFRGGLRITVDRQGRLAVVNLVPLEELLKGLVPSEIFARAHVEALKAQAVTARGEVLAKVGTKHLADPYLLCSEQHCAVYKGLSGEAPTTNTAVEQTRGQALFSQGGQLVDSVYSAVCGGHTEDNDVVWGGVPNPNLRGRPDLIAPTGAEPTPQRLGAYLEAELPAACRLSTFAQPTRYRWERRFTQEQVDALTADLGVGTVMAMTVTERGVSGRARLLLISGESGATQLRGELTIRKRFKMLNSAMFQVWAERDAAGAVTGWVFRGGGWGHGVGMCQTGAIGRAEAGEDYRAILRHYFNGAEVSHIY